MKNSILSLLLASVLLSCDNDDPAVTIDLQAEKIEFSVVPTSEFAGVATITGTVKNIGSNYASGSNQQLVNLYENSTLVKSIPFQNLNAGESIQISYSRAWNSSSPAEGEFPPDYRLEIAYDPDILIDGNPNNDDKNSSNNSKTESGRAINELF